MHSVFAELSMSDCEELYDLCSKEHSQISLVSCSKEQDEINMMVIDEKSVFLITVQNYSTVTDFAKFLGLSISQFFNNAT